MITSNNFPGKIFYMQSPVSDIIEKNYDLLKNVFLPKLCLEQNCVLTKIVSQPKLCHDKNYGLTILCLDQNFLLH